MNYCCASVFNAVVLFFIFIAIVFLSSTPRRRAADNFRDITGCTQSITADLSVRSLKQWERYAGSRCAEIAETYGATYNEYYLQRKSQRVLQRMSPGVYAVHSPLAYSRDSVNCYVSVSSPLAEPLRLCASAFKKIYQLE